jgi:protein O-GlcNAc transferase
LHTIDYYISSDSYHIHQELSHSQIIQSNFTEQVIKLPSLGFFFERPSLPGITADAMVIRDDDFYTNILTHLSTGASILADIVRQRQQQKIKVILCPQHLPKFHPSFDKVLIGILHSDESVRLLLLVKDRNTLWRRTLEQRWVQAIGIDSKRIVWLPSLSPEDYLLMLAIGDIMIDPFPFGGGVTTLEALSVLTPVITFPTSQTVPGLAAGMLLSMSTTVSNALIVASVDEYISRVSYFLHDPHALDRLRHILHMEVPVLYDAQESIRDWEQLLSRIAGTSAGK